MKARAISGLALTPSSRNNLSDANKGHPAAFIEEVWAGLQSGEIVVFDKAYVDFDHLHDLAARSVPWVTQAKTGFPYRAVPHLLVPVSGRIIKDQIVALKGAKW
jgi:hypothetical protein